MKKILLILMVFASLATYAQAEFPESVQLTNQTSTTATKVNVQESNGVVNTIAKADLIEVIEYASAINLPVTGVAGKIYVTIDSGRLYRWSGTVYNEISTGGVTSISGLNGVTVTNPTTTPIIGLGNITPTTVTTNSTTLTPVTAPTYAEGKVFYDSTAKTLVAYDDISGTSTNLGQELNLRARNNTGGTIVNGAVVYISGATGQNPTIALARANSLSTSVTIGIATHDILNNTVGKITTFGLVNELNTSAFTDGQVLYLSPTTAGVLTSTVPSSPNYTAYVCVVLHSHVTQGKIFVRPEQPISLNTALTDNNNTSPSVSAVKSYIDTGLGSKENISNKDNGALSSSETTYPTSLAVKTYSDNLVVGMLNDRGSWDASTNLFPTTGGSGSGGAIRKGDMWYVSVAGVLGSKAVNIGDSFRSLVNTPAQIATNWSVLEANIGYVPANDNLVVHLGGTETLSGTKIFTSVNGIMMAGSIPLTLNSYGKIYGGQNKSLFLGNNVKLTTSGTQINRVVDDIYTGSFIDMRYLSEGIVFGTNVTGDVTTNQNMTSYERFKIKHDGSLNIVNTPATSAGTYDFLTRNTSTGDIEKVLSTSLATTTQLNLKANIASPTFTGVPSVPTATAGTNTTQIASTAFVSSANSGNVTLANAQTINGEKTFNAKLIFTNLGGIYSANNIGAVGSTLYMETTQANPGVYLQSSSSSAPLRLKGAVGGSVLEAGFNGGAQILENCNIISTAFIKTGGTSSQFLMADGGVSTATPPIQLKDFYADVNNVGLTETDLLTYTTPASRLNAAGEKIISVYAGTMNDVTASSQLKAYFAGTLIADTGALTMSVTGAWVINASIIRTGATTARSIVNISTPGASTASYTKYTSLTGLTFTNTNIIKVTGTAAGATGGDNDITATYGNILWQPAAL